MHFFDIQIPRQIKQGFINICSFFGTGFHKERAIGLKECKSALDDCCGIYTD